VLPSEGAGITDWGSFIFTSDVAQTDYDARWPEEDPHDFEKFSAVDFAKNVTTPLLILHGAADVRVPTYQGASFTRCSPIAGRWFAWSRIPARRIFRVCGSSVLTCSTRLTRGWGSTAHNGWYSRFGMYNPQRYYFSMSG
jgi:hypothetical protein